MLIPLIIGFSLSMDPVKSVKDLINKALYRKAYETASNIIISQGSFDVDIVLFFLKGCLAYKLEKYEEAINCMTRFLNSRSSIKHLRERSQARSVRGNCNLLFGNINDLQIDIVYIYDKKLSGLLNEVQNLQAIIAKAERRKDFKTVLANYEKLISITLYSTPNYIKACQASLIAGNMVLFKNFTKRALKFAPKEPKLLEFMSIYYFRKKKIYQTQKYLKMCIGTASNANPCIILYKATLNFSTNYDAALKYYYSRKFDRAMKNINICEQIALKYSPPDMKLVISTKTLKLKILFSQDMKETAIKYANELIKISPYDDDLKITRGELYFKLGLNNEAMLDFQDVMKRQTNNPKVINYIKKISAIFDKEKNINYYSLFELRRGSPISEIKKAYRKMVIKWHPDRHKEAPKKLEAERKMKIINNAYDVLSDPWKKRLYDMGENPNE